MTEIEHMRSYPDEEWKEIAFAEGALRKKYAISNYGRLLSFSDKISQGKLLKGGLLGGYPTFVCRPHGTSKTFYLHKLVAQYFIPKDNEEQKSVIHLDYNKKNNHVSNLRWASKREVEVHQQQSPLVKKSREKRRNQKPRKGHKLSATDVIRIKRRIFDPNRKTRMKIIAKQFGISEMQLYRIKSGENWSHIKAPIPPNGQKKASTEKEARKDKN